MARGSAGRWRRGRVMMPRVDEYSVGPQNINLDASNYRGAKGTSLNDLHRMGMRAKKDGAQMLVVYTLIRRTSQTPEAGFRRPGFRWIATTGIPIDEFLLQVENAMKRRESVDTFAYKLHDADYPIKDAVTWNIVAY